MRRADSWSVLAILTALAISCFQPLVALAQDMPPPAFGQPTAAAPANTINCFDYYHFGSVQVDVTPSVASAVSGVPITFTGSIKNRNPYPVVDGSVYVKIFRERGNGEKDSNGFQWSRCCGPVLCGR